MVPMPPMIDTYDLKLFYTLCTYNSVKRFVLKRIKHSLAVIRENPILDCVALCDGTWVL